MNGLRAVGTVTAIFASVVLFGLSPRQIDAPDVHEGTYRFEFIRADGFTADRITFADYAKLVAAGACGPRSAVTRYPAQRLIQAVCELGE